MSEVLRQELGLTADLVSRLQERSKGDEDLASLVRCVVESPAQALRNKIESMICDHEQLVHDLEFKCEKTEQASTRAQRELEASRESLNKLRVEYLQTQNENILNSMKCEPVSIKNSSDYNVKFSASGSTLKFEREKWQVTLREKTEEILGLKIDNSHKEAQLRKAADDLARVELEKQLLLKERNLSKSQEKDSLGKLAEKLDEIADFKTEKLAHIAELDANLARVKTESQVLKKTSELYLSQRDEAIQKLAQSQESYNKISQRIADQEQSFQNEIRDQTNNTKFYQELADNLEKRVRLLENELTSSSLEHQRYVSQVETIEIKTKKAFENLHAELRALTEENDNLLALNRSDDTPENPDSEETVVSLRLELLRAKRDYRNIQQNLKELVMNIKLKQPILEEQRSKHDFLYEKNRELCGQLIQSEAEKDKALFESRETRAEIHQLNVTNKALSQQVSKLSRQVQTLLSQREAQNAGNGLDVYLTPFSTIQELHTKNMQLQAVVDGLAERFEAEEARLKANIGELQEALDGDTSRLVERTTQEIQELKDRIQVLETDVAICDRVIKSMTYNSKENHAELSPEHQLIVSRLENEVGTLKRAAAEAHNQALAKTGVLYADIGSKDVEIAYLNVTMSSLKDTLRMVEEDLKLKVLEADENTRCNEELNTRIVGLTHRIGELECSLEREKVLGSHFSQKAQYALQENADLKALATGLHDEKARLASKVAEFSAEVSGLKMSLQDSNDKCCMIEEKLRLEIRDVSLERDEALARFDACLLAQESQSGRQGRILASSEERMRQVSKEASIRAEALQVELKASQEECLQTKQQLSKLQEKLDSTQRRMLLIPTEDSSPAVLQSQLEEKTAAYQTVRDALDELSALYAQFKAQANAEILKEKEKTKHQEELSAQVDTLSNQLAVLQNEAEIQQQAAAHEKILLEKEISSLRSSLDEMEEARRAREDEVASLNSIVEHATLGYEEELVRHADKIQLINTLKAEIKTFKDQIADLQTKPISSQISTETGNQSTLVQLSEAIERIQDLEQLNLTLRTRLDSNTTSSTVDPGVGTRQLIKQCTDDTMVKMNSLSNANKALQLDLAELSVKLNRSHQELKKEREACRTLHHAELEDKELQNKLLDESNCFLRGERDQLLLKLTQVEGELETLRDQLGPARESMSSLKSDLVAKDAEIDLLRKENEQWTLRLQRLLLQDERIDPLEHTAVREEVLSLQSKMGDAHKTIKELEERIASDTIAFKELDEKAKHYYRVGMNIKKKYEALEAEKASYSSAPREHAELQSKHQDILKTLEAKSQKLILLQESLGVSEPDLVKGLEDLKDKLQAAEKARDDQANLHTRSMKLYKKFKALSDEHAAKIVKIESDLAEVKMAHEQEVQSLEEKSKTKLSQLEMRHKAQMSKPLNEVTQLKKEVAELRALNGPASPKRAFSPLLDQKPDPPALPIKKARSENAKKRTIPVVPATPTKEPSAINVDASESSQPEPAKPLKLSYDFLINDEDDDQDGESDLD